MTKIICKAIDCHNNNRKESCWIPIGDLPMNSDDGFKPGELYPDNLTRPPFCEYYADDKTWYNDTIGSYNEDEEDQFKYGREEADGPFDDNVECNQDLCQHTVGGKTMGFICGEDVIIMDRHPEGDPNRHPDGHPVCMCWKAHTIKTKMHCCSCGEPYPEEVQKILKGEIENE